MSLLFWTVTPNYRAFGSEYQQLNALGLKKKITQASGDCLFETIAYMLEDRSIDTNELRKLTYNEANDNRSQYTSFYTGNYDKDIRNILIPRLWNTELGDLFLLMISRALKRNIVVVRGGSPMHSLPDEETVYPGRKLYIVQTVTMDHYDATVRLDKEKQKGVRQLDQSPPSSSKVPRSPERSARGEWILFTFKSSCSFSCVQYFYLLTHIQSVDSSFLDLVFRPSV